MVSLKDIATDLNLSVGLVSKVLTGRMGTTGVSAATREQIIAKAREVGYEPNRIAQALRSGRIGTIGVFVHPWGERGTDITESFLRGVSEILGSTVFHLWLTFFEHDSDVTQRVNLQETRRQADALVIAGNSHPYLLPHLEEIDRAGLPIVLSEEGALKTNLVNISVDSYQQGRLPALHLIERGCRHLACISALQRREEGYLGALQEAGLTSNPALIQRASGYDVNNQPDRQHPVAPEISGFTIEQGRIATRRLLSSGERFDAIVAQSDHQALGALLELQNHGIRVPEQVRLIGVDDSPICDASPVPLSSVTSEAKTLGMETIRTVLQRLEGKPTASKLITPAVVPRASS